MPLLRKVTGGEFCCEEHRHAYAQEQSNLALSRLIDEQQSLQTGKKVRRRGIALPLPRTANGNGNGNGAHGKTGVHAGPDPAFCQWLYATSPQVQNFRPGLRSGETSLAGLSELAMPSANWRIVRKRLIAGDRIEWTALVWARGMTSAYAQGEPGCEFAAWDMGTRMSGRLVKPVWDEPVVEAPVVEAKVAGEVEPVAFAALVKIPAGVKARNWTAPMRSSLPKPWGVTAAAPALPAHGEARVRHAMGVEMVSTQMAPLIRSSRLLGKAIPSQMGYRPIAAEHRPWEAGQQIPPAAVAAPREVAKATMFSSLSVLAARGSVALLNLLEGNQLVTSSPMYPQVRADFNGLGLQRAARVAIATPYSNAGQTPVQAQAKGIFPLPFLVPPLSPNITAAKFRAPLEKVKQLTLAPRRGVESYQVSSLAVEVVETQAGAVLQPVAGLRPVLDWLPAFGRPVAPSWEVRAQADAGSSAAPARGLSELVRIQSPALATSILSIEQPAMPMSPTKLFRLTMDRVEMRNVKSRPMANTNTHSPVREVIKPQTRLVPRT
ncbi:MAG: hypothetical protein ABI972_18080, partial [Acidobacteriota bacterium]